jgi:peptidyl-prolyl cis-trans isomerase A (cyclophilin A)
LGEIDKIVFIYMFKVKTMLAFLLLLFAPLFSYASPEHSIVKCTTTKGPITIQVNYAWAPLGAQRFMELVRDGFYTNIAFYRCVQGFLTQFGISDNPAKAHWHFEQIRDDPNLHLGIRKHYVSFAGGGPHSRSTQIFIAFEDLDFLGKDPWETPFAVVIAGFDAVSQLYTGYGDIDSFGKGPNQRKVFSEGNDYIRKEFPQIDFLDSCEEVMPLSDADYNHQNEGAISKVKSAGEQLETMEENEERNPESELKHEAAREIQIDELDVQKEEKDLKLEEEEEQRRGDAVDGEQDQNRDGDVVGEVGGIEAEAIAPTSEEAFTKVKVSKEAIETPHRNDDVKAANELQRGDNVDRYIADSTDDTKDSEGVDIKKRLISLPADLLQSRLKGSVSSILPVYIGFIIVVILLLICFYRRNIFRFNNPRNKRTY